MNVVPFDKNEEMILSSYIDKNVHHSPQINKYIPTNLENILYLANIFFSNRR